MYYDEVEEQLENIASVLRTTPQESLRRVETLSAELKAALKEIDQLKEKMVSSSFDEVLDKAVDVDGIKIATARFEQLDMDALRNACGNLRSRIGTGVVVLASSHGGKVGFVAMASKDAVARGIHCGNIVREAAKRRTEERRQAGYGQAGGRDVSKIDEALKLAAEAAKAQVK